MKYKVLVENKSSKQLNYTVDVKKIGEGEVSEKQLLHKEKVSTFTENKEPESENDEELFEKIQIAVESSRLEYEHSFRRAERLDNKVYILLTACGFIFVLLTNAINKISEINVLSFQYTLIFLYDLTLIVSVIGTVALLIILILSLSGKDYKRYDTNKILEQNLITIENSKTLARYTIMMYEKAKDYNNKLISEQFKRMNMAVKLLIFVVIMLITLAILGNVVPTKENMQTMTEVTSVDVSHDEVELIRPESEEENVQTEWSNR